MEFAQRARAALNLAAIKTQQRNEGPPRTTREDLVAWVRAHMPGRDLVVVSNREPYSHEYQDGAIRVVRNAGGLTVALDAVMQALGGTWVAHGNGSADRKVVDTHDRIACPPERPRYQLRRLWLTRDDHARYYSGFANSALWPLCHVVYVRPRFRLADFESYRDVNRRFAEAALEEIGDRPALVFIQDYHLALAAKYLKEQRPGVQVAMFWHIPWPNPEILRVLPWKEEILEGMLSNDFIGFHIRRHAINFLDSVAETLEARVDLERLAVDRAGQRTWVHPFAISVDAEEIAALSETAETKRAEARIREQLGLEGCKIGLGVDRLDYTKGIPERLEAIERMFEKYPEWEGRFAFIQIGVPSRIELREYRSVQVGVRRRAERINQHHPRAGGPTVHVIEANLDFRDLLPYYRMADLCAVTSLHDGMNLVAKEYVAASPDCDGALVLSPFTGAARELERAWIVSPYDLEGLTDTFHAALSEPEEARRQRMAALHETVMRRNVFDWTLDVLDTLVGLNLRTPARESAAPMTSDTESPVDESRT
ncbi:MAG: alpha,alpha-trehalose-phosphate synthase (UDP-forming) [Candidatus Eiseniibacteriota bacterium]